MKKLFGAVMALAVFVSASLFGPDRAGAAGIITYRGGSFVWGKGVVFVFEASGYHNRDVRDASILVGSDPYDLHCTVNKQDGKIVCVAGGKLTRFAGQTGVIYLAGQMFYVTIPAKPARSSGNASLSCPPGQVPGAEVVFRTTGGDLTPPFFITGSTLAEVRNSAENWLGFDFESIEEIGPLECGEELT